jgi:hypothetical protein
MYGLFVGHLSEELTDLALSGSALYGFDILNSCAICPFSLDEITILVALQAAPSAGLERGRYVDTLVHVVSDGFRVAVGQAGDETGGAGQEL